MLFTIIAPWKMPSILSLTFERLISFPSAQQITQNQKEMMCGWFSTNAHKKFAVLIKMQIERMIEQKSFPLNLLIQCSKFRFCKNYGILLG